MGALIQVSGRSAATSAQRATVASKAVSMRTSNGSARIVRASRREGWNASSGITPRRSGSTRKTRGSSRPSPMGKTPAR